MLPPFLPPFPVVDHRIDRSPLPVEERRVIRRGAPERLRLELPSQGWPPLLLRAQEHPPRPLPAPPAREGGGWVRRLAGAFRLAVPS